MTSLLLGVLELERDPLRLADLGLYLRTWVQEAGLISAAGLVIYALATVFSTGRERSRVLPLVLICGIGALACYAVAGVSWMQEPPPPPPPVNAAGVIQKAPPAPATPQGERKELFLSIAGTLSLIGIALPFLFDLLACRPGRVWALAKLSFKEAIRRRVLFVFLGFLLLFLFPTKWFVQVKPEDEIRQTVGLIDLAMTVILVLAFGLLAAFSLPTDVKNQTIHTIVTKPVQRFEIILGRFLGFVGLATAVLLVLRTVSLIMIVYSNPSVEASFESFQARDPVFGALRFFNRRGEFEGEFVGREWELRKYIAGGANSSHRALFQFKDIPAGFLTAEQVPCEFSFDIFRTTKGEEEGRGVQISLFFSTPGWTDDKLPDYIAEMRRLGLNPARNPAPGDPDWKKWNELAEKFGYFELKGKEIADYHTFRVYVPAGLFKRGVTAAGPEMVPVAVRVKCESRTQFLGVAARDLYFLSGNQPFWLNFYKGAFGIWLLVTLVIGLAVSLSTFFSGVVSWLVAVGIVMLGYFREFIQEVAEGRAVGGGSLESGLRIVTNSNIISPLDNTPGAVAAQ
ncbi:MAG: hypothetical protein K1X57_10590, partial [Gemmataceae bacterium]|nr:hypothetical protein [Gemmataceae bacterium]